MLIRFVLIASLVTTTACARNLPEEQRRECRRIRGSAAARGIFIPVGIAVVAVVVLPVMLLTKSDGSSMDGSFFDGDGRRESRRDRRRKRREVCRDIQRALPPVSQEPTASPEQSHVALPPPDEAQLEQALRVVESDIRACAPNARGLLILDAAISGERGAITSFDLEGEGRGPQTRACVDSVLSRVRFDPFEGAMRVRWGINLSGTALPAPWENVPDDD